MILSCWQNFLLILLRNELGSPRPYLNLLAIHTVSGAVMIYKYACINVINVIKKLDYMPYYANIRIMNIDTLGPQILRK